MPETISITLAYPDGDGVTLMGRGAIMCAASENGESVCALTGVLTLGDVTQLLAEMADAFGKEELICAMSIALLSDRMEHDG